MTKTAKQLEEGARHKSLGYTVHTFTPEQLKAYREALCREQRELCADRYFESDCDPSPEIEEAIINAEEP